MDTNSKVPLTISLGIIMLFTMVAVIVNWWFWGQVYDLRQPGTEESKSILEKACKNSGGTVGEASCCLTTKNFSNNCVIGGCGCSSNNSHKIKVCNCSPDKCFNGETCIKR